MSESLFMDENNSFTEKLSQQSTQNKKTWIAPKLIQIESNIMGPPGTGSDLGSVINETLS